MAPTPASAARDAWPAWTGRRGPLVGEIAVLVLLVAVDTVFVFRTADPQAGYVAAVAESVTPGLGVFAAVLAVLRRRFPDRVAVLAGCVAGLSLLGTALTVVAAIAGQRPPPAPELAEPVALALLVGAGCRRLPAAQAVGVAVAGGLAMVVAPVLRDGTDDRLALLAVPAALLWGGALAAGLVLRDGDYRRATEITAARERTRTAERLLMARELHDLVAHHITGVVVRAQAARAVAGHDDAIFAEIEQAGAEALAATRQLVGILRTGQGPEVAAPSGIADAVRHAVPSDGTVTVTLPDLTGHTAPAPTVGAVHRVVLEAMTNVRRHAPDAGDVHVDVRVDQRDDRAWLVVDIVNDGAAPSRRRGGYGLVGMTERVTAVGGTMEAGPQPDGRWLVSARVPLDAA